MITENENGMSDHDRIIRIDTRLKDLIDTVNEIKDGTADRISSLELGVNDLDKMKEECKKDIGNLQSIQKILMSLGAFFLVFLFGMVVWHILGYHL